jgi:hypothetical protein
MRQIQVLLRLVLLGATAGLVLLAGPGPAGAGGSSLYFEQAEYLPGETARASGVIGMTSSEGTGWIDDGPYLAYLIETDRYSELAATNQQWPFVPAEATRVGEVRAATGPPCCSATFTLEFVVPTLPRGHYAMLLCNEPCTESPGDWTGGGIAINAAGAPPLTELVAPDAAAAADAAAAEPDPTADQPRRMAATTSAAQPKVPENDELAWWWPVAAIGFAGLVVAMTIRRTRTHAARAR